MAETTLTERLISGKGVLRVPPTEAAMRYVSLLIDVIRQPATTDLSFRYSPPRQRYCTLVFLRGGYVVQEVPVDYKRRRLDWILDPTGQLLVALKCANKQIQGKLGGSSSNIASFANLKLLWDEVQIVCYLDTAVQVKLRMDILDDCGDDYSEKEPPPPPDPLPEVPPGTPIADISPPYEDGDDVTQAYPTDEYTPPPEPTTLSLWTVVTSSRTLTIASFNTPVTYHNNRCDVQGNLEVIGLEGANSLRQYCDAYTNYCLNPGETIISITKIGDCADPYIPE